ncbi:hypothetical protein [Dyella sp. ASV21]|uniref:hypothetical protein n=1 Tax=Dyella sp. ASV21 TaxID=2795114 RepID=UPI0018EBFB75|nr:hypothetical protein [Dyella sp. ASV21]
MTPIVRFPYARFLDALEQALGAAPEEGSTVLSSPLAGLLRTPQVPGAWTPAAVALVPLLKARQATLQAASDTELAADELRRYQKYAKPGKPSAHIVQLRQRQAAARQATHTSRQSLMKTAAAFVREAGLDVPERVALDAFIVEWLDMHIPKDAAPGA